LLKTRRIRAVYSHNNWYNKQGQTSCTYELNPLIKLKSLCENSKDKDLSKSLDKIRSVASDLIETSRSFTFDLSYPVLYELGLEAAIEQWLTSKMAGKYDFTVKYKNDKQPKPIDINTETFIFKAVRELLVNVLKHSKAKNVCVSISRNRDNLIVSVEDDGIGMDVSKNNYPGGELTGFGLFNIRDRLDYLGGHCEVKSESGKGTRVTLKSPLKK